MDAIWKKADEQGFSTTFKNKIIQAYLSSVEQVLPKVRSKVRSSTLGLRDRHSETGGKKKEEVEESSSNEKNVNNRGSNSRPRTNSNNGKREIDWSKTTDIDYFNDRITYKE